MSELLELWEKVSSNSAKVKNLLPQQQANLLQSLKELDLVQLARIRSYRDEKRSSKPFLVAQDALEPTERLISSGQEELAAGKVSILILAGGQGSRLGKVVPKGIFPLTQINKKSLFQIFAEKQRSAQKKYNRAFSLSIMTSKQNYQQITQFFAHHKYWGLDPANIYFFIQDELPLLDLNGDPWLAHDGSVCTAPNGNGGAFRAFAKSGILAKISEEGAAHLMVIPVDNPFADPLNPTLIGATALQCRNQSELNRGITFKAVMRKDINEETGVFVLQKSELRVIEYTEYSEEKKAQRSTKKSDDAGMANTGEFCISATFAKKLGEMPYSLWPIHQVKKNIAASDCKQFENSLALKTEFFIMDLLQWAKDAVLTKFDRHLSFAPLKNLHGPRGLKNIQTILQATNDSQYL